MLAKITIRVGEFEIDRIPMLSQKWSFRVSVCNDGIRYSQWIFRVCRFSPFMLYLLRLIISFYDL